MTIKITVVSITAGWITVNEVGTSMLIVGVEVGIRRCLVITTTGVGIRLMASIIDEEVFEAQKMGTVGRATREIR